MRTNINVRSTRASAMLKATFKNMLSVALPGALLSAGGFYGALALYLFVVWANSVAVDFLLLSRWPALYALRESECRPSVKDYALLVAFCLPAGLTHGDWGVLPYLGATVAQFGYLVVLAAFAANPWASKRTLVFTGQAVISTGIYSYCRHPIYLGNCFVAVGSALMLQSWFGLAVLAAVTFINVHRAMVEDLLLRQRLPGYRAYAARVRRLM